MAGATCVVSSIHFLERNPSLYATEKSYHHDYEPPTGTNKTNMRLDKRDDVTIEDIRGREHQFSLEKNGFAVLDLSNIHGQPDEYYSEPFLRETYFPQLAHAVKAFLGASRVQIFDFGVRKQDIQFPISAGGQYEFRQPASLAHTDRTSAALPEVQRVLSDFAGSNSPPSGLRCQYVNVWKPLRGPLRQWPLALCDPASLDPASDLQPHDFVQRDSYREQFYMHHAPGQRWYYLRDQMPDEGWIFLQADSSGTCGVPHSAFPHPDSSPSDSPRESIEVRLLAYFDDTVDKTAAHSTVEE